MLVTDLFPVCEIGILMFKRAIYFTLKSSILLLFLLLMISVYRTLTLEIPHVDTPISLSEELLEELKSPSSQTARLERLSQALQLRVISTEEPPPPEDTEQMIQWLHREFPEVSRQLTWIKVGQSVVIIWDPPRAQSLFPPILALAHFDVVPAGDDWLHPPHSGLITENEVWGRGALDDRSAVVAWFEALTLHLRLGTQLNRSFVLALDHDEEVGGLGALAMREWLETWLSQQPRGHQSFAWALDEGGYLTEGIIPNIQGSRAIVGIAEKGHLTLDVTLSGESGHASMPPKITTIGALSVLLSRLEQSSLPIRIDGAAALSMRWLAPDLPLLQRWALSNLWLTQPVVERIYESKPSTAALIKTTTAITQLNAGDKYNRLAASSHAVINFRLIPGDTPDTIQTLISTRLQTWLDELEVEYSLNITARPAAGNPSRVSAVTGPESEGWRLLQRSLRTSHPSARVVPNLTIGATDSRHFAEIVKQTYRFRPLSLTPQDLGRIHGSNERILKDDYHGLVHFFVAYLTGLARPK